MEFCYARVGRGVAAPPSTDADGLDVRWERNRNAAIAAGLRLGGYWRFFPALDADLQVDRFCARLEGTTLPPMVDIEDQHPDWTVEELTDWAVTVLGAVHTRVGRAPILYTYRWALANALEADRLVPRWPLALAASTDAWPDERATLHQYALNVKVPWAAGNVDLVRWRGPLPV